MRGRLTEVHTRGQAWWTLGFEATGPTSLLRRELETTVALVLDQDLPDDMKLDTGHSQSYAEWLGWQPGSEPTPTPDPQSPVKRRRTNGER